MSRCGLTLGWVPEQRRWPGIYHSSSSKGAILLHQKIISASTFGMKETLKSNGFGRFPRTSARKAPHLDPAHREAPLLHLLHDQRVEAVVALEGHLWVHSAVWLQKRDPETVIAFFACEDTGKCSGGGMCEMCECNTLGLKGHHTQKQVWCPFKVPQKNSHPSNQQTHRNPLQKAGGKGIGGLELGG